MYHELLLALAGHSGDLFLADGKVATDFPHLHPGTRQALDRLLPLSLIYRDLDYFTQHLSLPSTSRSPSSSPSAYLEALGVGLEPILQDYRNTLTTLESQCIGRATIQSDDIPATQLPLVEFTLALSPHSLVLPRIHAILEHIFASNMPGPKILDYLDEQSLTGIPELSFSLYRMNYPMRALLYRQMAVWVGWGRVIDPYHELFIPASSMDASSRMSMHDAEESLLEEVTGLDVYLDPSRTPSILTTSSMKDLLFIGQAIRALLDHGAISSEEASSLANKHSAEIYHLLPSLTSSSSSTTTTSSSTSSFTSSSSFHLPPRDSLSRILAIQRRRVAGRLWKAAVIEYGAAEQLTAFRRFFLLGDGPFIDHLLRSLSLGMRERDVEAAWRRAAPGTYAEMDPHFPDFNWVSVDKAIGQTGPETWMSDGQIGCGIHLRLAYSLSWPMNLIVSSRDLTQYSTAFSFLFVVKRTLLRLQALLALPGPLGRHPAYTTLRHRILTWVSALYTHFQVSIRE